MEDSPELVKMLKYILFGYYFLSPLSPAYPHPPEGYNQHEDFPSFRSDLISSFSEHREAPFHHGGPPPPPHKNFNYKKSNDLDPNEKGHLRSHPQQQDRRGHPHPPQRYGEPFEKFGGSLCSIFRTFLELRGFHRCHVSNGGQKGPYPQQRYPNYPRNNRGPPPPLPHVGNNDLHEKDLMGMQLREDAARKRFDHHNRNHPHLEETQINNSGEEQDFHMDSSDPDSIMEHEHHGHRGQEGHRRDLPYDPTKISQDRTMILVPERTCPPGHRRDSRGYCRRVVKIRTNYQYGPPPPYQKAQMSSNNVVRSIPIRYYYSRIVTIPAFQFYFPNV